MSRIRIRHSTGFRYEGDVHTSYNEARMLPAAANGQYVLYSHLDVLPSTSTHSYIDYWGTKVTAFDVLNGHHELSLTAASLIEVTPRGPRQDASLDWAGIDDARERSVSLVEQTEQTALTEPPAEVVSLAWEARSRTATADAAAAEILSTVHRSVEYEAGVTGVRTTAEEAWAERRGVCQDISHIALGALRAVGIPSRYVSGYLHPQPDAPLGQTVDGESHAWVEYWDGAWRGWDPTNDVEIGERHVLVGHGRDYNDVPPLRGVYAGLFTSEMFVKVEITREA